MLRHVDLPQPRERGDHAHGKFGREMHAKIGKNILDSAGRISLPLLDMLRFFASAYMDLCSTLGRMEAIADKLDDTTKKSMVDVPFAENWIWRRAGAACSRLGLQVGTKQLERIVERIKSGSLTYEEMGRMIGELRNRIQDESSARVFVYIPTDRGQYLGSTNLFGDLVAKYFTASIKDIEEAGSCFAFGRGTATVFHLMRVMEDGLRHVASRLSIPYAPSWESYIKQIGDQVAVKHDHKTVDWKRDEPFFKEVLGDLIAIKTAWRNPTMHIVRHYDSDEAEDVLRAVRRFMIRIAEDAERAASDSGAIT